LAVKLVGAGAGRIEQAENRQQRRLAAAGRAGNRHVLAPLDLQRDLGERMRLDFVRDENLRQLVEHDDGRGIGTGHASSYCSRTRSNESQVDMSVRITWSPTLSPDRI